MAGTVIDSMTLELSLDPSQWSEGQKKALDMLRELREQGRAGAKEVESQAKRTTDTLMNFRREALTTLGVFLGGMGVGQFINTITNLDASVGRLGKTMGTSAEDVSTWQGMIQQVGGSSESANASLAGLNSEMVRFSLTGQSSMLGVLTQLGVSLYDQNHNLKTSVALYRDLTEAIEKRKLSARDAAGLLSMIPGMNQDTINLILKGTKAYDAFQKAAREAGGTTRESAAAAEEYQRAMANMERSSMSLGRTLTTMLAPSIAKVFDAITWGLNSLRDTKEQREAREKKDLEVRGGVTTHDELRERFGKPPKWLQDLFGIKDEPQRFRPAPVALPVPVQPASGGRGYAGSSDREAYIRRAAAARGIDPDTAVAVARSEGLGGAYSGDRGSSFGDFQLHYGGVASGGMAVKGLGDAFTKKTGLDARDPSTWQQQTDFALDEARRSGWGAWHGWKGQAFAGIGAGGWRPGAAAAAGGAPGNQAAAGGGTSTVTTTVENVTVNTQATDAGGIARDIAPALRRAVDAGAVNYGAI